MATTRDFNALFEGTLYAGELAASGVTNLVPGCVVTWDTGSVTGATGTSNKTLGIIASEVISDPNGSVNRGFTKPIDPTIQYPGDKASSYVDGGIYRYVMGMTDNDDNIIMPSGLSVGDVVDPDASNPGCFVSGTAGSGQNVLKVLKVSGTQIEAKLLI